MNRRLAACVAASVSLLLTACASESSQALKVDTTQAAKTSFAGVRTPVSIGKFDDHSGFMAGVFSDGVDRLGTQAKTTLIAHLQQAQRFSVLERSNMSETAQEAKIRNTAQALKGASYVITGDISEFGRKETGDRELFGILGHGKTQVAYAKITLNVVDVTTSEVVYSARGAGQYELSNRQVIGFGGTAGYDATLNGKVLDLAMREAVDNLVAGRDAGQWGTAQ